MEMIMEGFRHRLAIQVRWGDMDALGHVNNATYLTYLEQARIDYVGVLKLRDGRSDRPGLIVAKVVIDFKKPLFAGDDVHVFSRCTRLGNRSFDMEQIIARGKDDTVEIAAQALITIVVYDYSANRSGPIPDEWRALVKAYEVVRPNEAT